jgi:hypothetical protein
MTLRQQIAALIEAWLGSDAAERSELRPRLITDLISLLRDEKPLPQQIPVKAKVVHKSDA